MNSEGISSADPLCSPKSMHILQSALPNYGSISSDSTNLGSFITKAFILKKIQHVSGATQFNPVLFTAQLHFPSGFHNNQGTDGP